MKLDAYRFRCGTDTCTESLVMAIPRRGVIGTDMLIAKLRKYGWHLGTYTTKLVEEDRDIVVLDPLCPSCGAAVQRGADTTSPLPPLNGVLSPVRINWTPPSS